MKRKIRFKIDLRMRPSAAFFFGLYVARFGLWKTRWVEIEYFKTRDEAVACYEKIKNLPEYLA